MKRRKSVNKYAIGQNGTIENLNPTFSKRTSDLLSFMALSSIFTNNENYIDNEGSFIDDMDMEFDDTDVNDEEVGNESETEDNKIVEINDGVDICNSDNNITSSVDSDNNTGSEDVIDVSEVN